MKTRTLSRLEARVVLSLEADGKDEVTLDAIQSRAHVSRSHARKIAHDLAGKRWLERVGRGRYLLNPARHGVEARSDADPFRIGSRLVAPYYFGFATAAELHHLLPQAGRTYYVVTPAPARSRSSRLAEYRVVHVPPTRFWGATPVVRRGLPLSVSDLERTVLDCLDRPELSGGIGGAVQVLDSAGARLSWARLGRYLDRRGSRSLALRVGYLAGLLAPRVRPPAAWVREFRARAGEPYVPLGRPSEFGRRGTHDPTWHVVDNVPRPLLLGEVDVR
jgi:predicted transcriptional regulator of viral defense system